VTSERTYHEKLGLAVAAMMASDAYCRYPVACLTEWVKPAILLDQIHFFFDRTGHLGGYLTWAFLTEDTEERLIGDPRVLLHLSEWNEGDRLWFMDMVVINTEIRRYLSYAKTTLFPGAQEAFSLRRRSDGSVYKVVTWRGGD